MSLDSLLVSSDVLLFVANVLLVILVLSTIGLIAKLVIRKFSAPFQHSLLVGIVGLLILSPVLVWIAGSFQIGLLHLPAKEPLAVHVEPEVVETATIDITPETIPIQQLPEPVLIPNETVVLIKPEITTNLPQKQPDINPNVSTHSHTLPVVTSPPLLSSQSSTLPPDNTIVVAWWQVAGSFLMTLWGVGTLFVFLRSLRGWIFVKRLKKNLQQPSKICMQQMADEIAEAMQVATVPVRMSSMVPVPITVGLIRPVIVIPATQMATLSDAQLYGVLRHEIAHVVRHDLWIGMIQHVATILFWWNVALYRLNERISELCEQICDDIVLQSQTDARDYGLLLLEMAGNMAEPVEYPTVIGLLKSKENSLQKRITRLINKERNMTTQLNRTTKTMLIGAGLLLTVGLLFSTIVADDTNKTKQILGKASLKKEQPSNHDQQTTVRGVVFTDKSASKRTDATLTEHTLPAVITPKKKEKHQINIEGVLSRDGKTILLLWDDGKVTKGKDAKSTLQKRLDQLKKKGIKSADVTVNLMFDKNMPYDKASKLIKLIQEMKIKKFTLKAQRDSDKQPADVSGSGSVVVNEITAATTLPAVRTAKPVSKILPEPAEITAVRKHEHIFLVRVVMLRDRDGKLLHKTPLLYWEDGQVTQVDQAKTIMEKILKKFKKQGVKPSELTPYIRVDRDASTQQTGILYNQMRLLKFEKMNIGRLAQGKSTTLIATALEPQDLLKQIDPEKHRVGAGIWRVKDNKVIAYPAAHGSRLRIPLQTPEKKGGYRLTARWEPKAEGSHVIFMLPHGKSVASFEIMGSLPCAGVGDLNGVRPDVNETKTKIEKLKPGKVYDIMIIVRYDEKIFEVQATMDNKMIANWKGKRSELKSTYFSPSKPASFGLSVAGEVSTFHALKLHMLIGSTTAWKKPIPKETDPFSGGNRNSF